jgi:hypothetical protein
MYITKIKYNDNKNKDDMEWIYNDFSHKLREKGIEFCPHVCKNNTTCNKCDGCVDPNMGGSSIFKNAVTTNEWIENNQDNDGNNKLEGFISLMGSSLFISFKDDESTLKRILKDKLKEHNKIKKKNMDDSLKEEISNITNKINKLKKNKNIIVSKQCVKILKKGDENEQDFYKNEVDKIQNNKLFKDNFPKFYLSIKANTTELGRKTENKNRTALVSENIRYNDGIIIDLKIGKHTASKRLNQIEHEGRAYNILKSRKKEFQHTIIDKTSSSNKYGFRTEGLGGVIRLKDDKEGEKLFEEILNKIKCKFVKDNTNIKNMLLEPYAEGGGKNCGVISGCWSKKWKEFLTVPNKDLVNIRIKPYLKEKTKKKIWELIDPIIPIGINNDTFGVLTKEKAKEYKLEKNKLKEKNYKNKEAVNYIIHTIFNIYETKENPPKKIYVYSKRLFESTILVKEVDNWFREFLRLRYGDHEHIKEDNVYTYSEFEEEYKISQKGGNKDIWNHYSNVHRLFNDVFIKERKLILDNIIIEIQNILNGFVLQNYLNMLNYGNVRQEEISYNKFKKDEEIYSKVRLLDFAHGVKLDNKSKFKNEKDLDIYKNIVRDYTSSFLNTYFCFEAYRLSLLQKELRRRNIMIGKIDKQIEEVLERLDGEYYKDDEGCQYYVMKKIFDSLKNDYSKYFKCNN